MTVPITDDDLAVKKDRSIVESFIAEQFEKGSFINFLLSFFS